MKHPESPPVPKVLSTIAPSAPDKTPPQVSEPAQHQSSPIGSHTASDSVIVAPIGSHIANDPFIEGRTVTSEASPVKVKPANAVSGCSRKSDKQLSNRVPTTQSPVRLSEQKYTLSERLSTVKDSVTSAPMVHSPGRMCTGSRDAPSTSSGAVNKQTTLSGDSKKVDELAGAVSVAATPAVADVSPNPVVDSLLTIQIQITEVERQVEKRKVKMVKLRAIMEKEFQVRVVVVDYINIIWRLDGLIDVKCREL